MFVVWRVVSVLLFKVGCVLCLLFVVLWKVLLSWVWICCRWKLFFWKLCDFWKWMNFYLFFVCVFGGVLCILWFMVSWLVSLYVWGLLLVRSMCCEWLFVILWSGWCVNSFVCVVLNLLVMICCCGSICVLIRKCCWVWFLFCLWWCVWLRFVSCLIG